MADHTDGQAIYTANIVLGRVALARGDRAAALDHLARAGKTRGSAVLGSFGPELELADELLQLGERAAVSSFLVEVERFWSSGRERVAAWRAAIEGGESPRLDRFRR